MIALIILGALLILILLILFLPINVFISFKDFFIVKIKFAGIKFFEIPKEKNKTSKSDKETENEVAQKDEQPILMQSKELFSFLKEKYGFFGAVKKLLLFLGNILTHIKRLLTHIKIKNIRFIITVSESDAASTAIQYGKVCSAAYPVLSFLDSFSSVNFKQIDINSDFTENKKEFEFSLNVKLQIIYMLIAAFKIYLEYKNFTLKENYNERK